MTEAHAGRWSRAQVIRFILPVCDIAAGWDRESGDCRLQFVRKLFSNWVKLVPNKKTKTMCTRNNKAIWRIMEHANKSVFSCCWLAAGRGCFQLHDIENWPESSHKITVLDHRLGIWRKYSEFQVSHLHKQSPPISKIVSNCQTAHFANSQACPWRERGLDTISLQCQELICLASTRNLLSSDHRN